MFGTPVALLEPNGLQKRLSTPAWWHAVVHVHALKSELDGHPSVFSTDIPLHQRQIPPEDVFIRSEFIR